MVQAGPIFVQDCDPPQDVGPICPAHLIEGSPLDLAPKMYPRFGFVRGVCSKRPLEDVDLGVVHGWPEIRSWCRSCSCWEIALSARVFRRTVALPARTWRRTRLVGFRAALTLSQTCSGLSTLSLPHTSTPEAAIPVRVKARALSTHSWLEIRTTDVPHFRQVLLHLHEARSRADLPDTQRGQFLDVFKRRSGWGCPGAAGASVLRNSASTSALGIWTNMCDIGTESVIYHTHQLAASRTLRPPVAPLFVQLRPPLRNKVSNGTHVGP